MGSLGENKSKNLLKLEYSTLQKKKVRNPLKVEQN